MKKRTDLKEVKEPLKSRDFTTRDRKFVYQHFGFKRDCPVARACVVNYCQMENLVPLFGRRKHVSFMLKPDGNEGVALERLMDTYLTPGQKNRKGE